METDKKTQTGNKTTGRLPYPDMMRGFAVILVVLGHCIQMGNGASYTAQSLFYEDKVYQFIYTFHMPLFMLISGYFAQKSMARCEQKDAAASFHPDREEEKIAPAIDDDNDNSESCGVRVASAHSKDRFRNGKTEAAGKGGADSRRKLLSRRLASLLIPIAFWTLFEIVVAFVRTLLTIPADDPVFHDKVVGLIRIELGEIPSHFLTELWFLWAELWSFLAVYVIRFRLHDSWKAYLALELVFFVTPDAWNFGVYKYMFSFYLAGYGYSKLRCHGLSEKSQKLLCDKPRHQTDEPFGEDCYSELPCRKRHQAECKPAKRDLLSKVGDSVLRPAADRSWQEVAAWGIAFGVLFIFFRSSVMIYLSGYRMNFTNGWHSALLSVVKDGYRFVIGMAGSVFFLLLLGKLFARFDAAYRSIPARILTALGQYTMGIYIVSGYYIIFGVSNLTSTCSPSYARNILEAVIVLALSYGTTRLLAMVPGLRKTVGK